MTNVFLIIFITTCFTFVSTHVWGQVKGLIVGPGAERFTIAVSPLKHLGKGKGDQRISEGMADIIARDLNLSSWFRVLNRSAYIEQAQNSGIKLGRFDFRDWSTIGAEALIKGGFKVQSGKLTVELRFFDVFQRKRLLGKRYSGTKANFRRIAHKFVDEVIFKITGIPGSFDSRIAYVSTAGGRFKEIYVSHFDLSEKNQVTNNQTINLFPSWAPDGRSILYTSYQRKNAGVYQFDIFSSKEKSISIKKGLNLGGKWSPGGDFITLARELGGNLDLYLLNSSGKVVRRLTKSPGIDVSPAWSPKGDRIVFVSNRSGSPQLYILNIVDGTVRRLTYSGGYNTSPDWSPKGDKIAYTGRSSGRFNIFSINPEGGDPKMLTSGAGDSEDPSWSPDGRFILFTSNKRGRYDLYLMRDNGENQIRLTALRGDATNPSWSPRLK